jgi:glycosyltransferase involved in cell wall biosynthesis
MTSHGGDTGGSKDAPLGRRVRQALAGLLGARREPPEGVNLIGYARGGLGLGEVLRRFSEAARQGGLAFSLVDFDVNLGDRGQDRRLDAWIGTENRYPVNLFFVNADQMPFARDFFGEGFFAGKRNIGFWFWELEGFPREWLPSLELVDEVWVATRFVQAAIRPHTSKPVRRVTLPVEVALPRRFSRAEFGLPEDRFVFLTSFDFHSYAQRKNPQAAIAAFRSAFPRGDEPAMLVVKSMNGDRTPHEVARIREATGGDPRIVLLDAFLDRDRTTGLTDVSDCYVSLHRAEGFGLGIAEAMCLGKPVIATEYSGNLDFTSAQNSCLTSARLVPVAHGDYPFGDGQRWAEPDVERAAAHMRSLISNPDAAASMGRAAAAYMARHHSYAAALGSMRAALRGSEEQLPG